MASRPNQWKVLAGIVFMAACLGSACFTAAALAAVKVTTQTSSGSVQEISLYSGYHALVIGCSNYQQGWPSLPNAAQDARQIGGMLKKFGWDVDMVIDPDGRELKESLYKLIAGPGKEKERGILIWYSGHGYTLKEADGSKLGYIVPTDAPDPEEDELGFMNTAISMRDIETVAKRIFSKHVLVMFDSCFSGAIFRMVRAKPSHYIKEKVSEPVRQFITAGNENEEVPDKSIFKELFIKGVRDSYGDRNEDSFITGEELGAYLAEEVVNYSRGAQHPQYGKINNPALDRGDFVFVTTEIDELDRLKEENIRLTGEMSELEKELAKLKALLDLKQSAQSDVQPSAPVEIQAEDEGPALVQLPVKESEGSSGVRPEILQPAKPPDNAPEKISVAMAQPPTALSKKTKEDKTEPKVDLRSIQKSKKEVEKPVDESTYWNSIKESADPKEFQVYLDKFPDGKNKTLAILQINRMNAAKPGTYASRMKIKAAMYPWQLRGEADRGIIRLRSDMESCINNSTSIMLSYSCYNQKYKPLFKGITSHYLFSGLKVDTKKIMGHGKRLGVDIAIIGDAYAKPGSSSSPYTATIYFIDLHNGRIYSSSKSGTKQSFSDFMHRAVAEFEKGALASMNNTLDDGDLKKFISRFNATDKMKAALYPWQLRGTADRSIVRLQSDMEGCLGRSDTIQLDYSYYNRKYKPLFKGITSRYLFDGLRIDLKRVMDHGKQLDIDIAIIGDAYSKSGGSSNPFTSKIYFIDLQNSQIYSYVKKGYRQSFSEFVCGAIDQFEQGVK